MKEIQAVRGPAHYHAEADEGIFVMTGERETLGGEVRRNWKKTLLRI